MRQNSVDGAHHQNAAARPCEPAGIWLRKAIGSALTNNTVTGGGVPRTLARLRNDGVRHHLQVADPQ